MNNLEANDAVKVTLLGILAGGAISLSVTNVAKLAFVFVVHEKDILVVDPRAGDLAPLQW